MMPLRLAVIIGSTREGRMGDRVGRWFVEQAEQRGGITVGCPRRTSSPAIRRQPQREFSRASRSTSAFTALAVGGLPGLPRRML
jgi:hypothetical protein